MGAMEYCPITLSVALETIGPHSCVLITFLSMATGLVTVYCMCLLKVYERNESPLYILGITYVLNGLKSVI